MSTRIHDQDEPSDDPQTSALDDAYDAYDHAAIEAKWQARWEAEGTYLVDVDRADPATKFFNAVEFPYPSAEGLHVGNVFKYSGADVFGRYQRMAGRDVFQPIGFDSFGIHTENYALRVGEHPRALTERTIGNFRRQLHRIGAGWDWSHEFATSDPSYYRWTQWVFLQLYRAGLAVREDAEVVWCPSCRTVLAFEQLEGDRCERCGTEATRRFMKQWQLRITAYADQLLAGLDDLDWPDISKRLQRDWIGRSEGVEVDFAIAGRPRDVLSAFTTRVDTLFGVTFLAVPPGHPIIERADRDAPPQAGTRTGVEVLHPTTGERIPVVIADYVVASYGTGAIMGVPAHDARDHEFAVEADLPIATVVLPAVGADAEVGTAVTGGAWTDDGVLTGSGEFDGLDSATARDAIADWLASRGLGRRAVRYRLHDWLISRQRYWGPPIPIVHCDACGEVPVPEEDLPVLLPEVEDFHPAGTGESPLASVESFVNISCPSCGGAARRETDVSDTFLDSAWYLLRYPSSDVADAAWDPERTGRMLPVDQYAGGSEHIRRHHLYARFVTRALHDLGLVSFAEPFPRLRLGGLLTMSGAKMSKSRGNVVTPDEFIDRVGADVLRLHLLFCAPWEEGGAFSSDGLPGIERFVRRAWRLVTAPDPDGPGGVDARPLHRAIARVGRDVERMKFNTAVAALMEVVRWASSERAVMTGPEWRETTRTIALLLAPFAPHVAEEMWERLGGPFSVHRQPWPSFDPDAVHEDMATIAVQVDGRVRDRIQVAADADRDDALSAALRSDRVRRHLGDAEPRQVVYVPGRILNLVS
ncbi:MAG TPA: leucine--tRNA ligase [Actinomycetota bacterium]